VGLFAFGAYMVVYVLKLKASGKDPMDLVSLPRDDAPALTDDAPLHQEA
jgi:hypothetical protein